jgi:hypothetical protein
MGYFWGGIFSLLLCWQALAETSADTGVLRFGNPNWSKKLLMVPGLNFNPEKFYEIKDALTENQIEVHLLHLKFTHEKDRQWEDGELSQHWLGQFEAALATVEKESQQLGGSYRLLAYSLGALVTETYLQSLKEEPAHLNRLVYLAPALSIKWYLRFFMNSARILEESIEIPSWNLEEYQTRSYTYAGEYEALLNILEKFEVESEKKMAIETHLFMSAKDELLNFHQVVEILQRLRLQLEVNEIKSSKKNTLGKHHLIVDSKSLLEPEFQKILNTLIH